MVLPVNQPIRFRVTGQDVIHSFYVPQFFYKKDAIPGRVNEFDLTITDPGTYGGQCAEFCGLGHSKMYFTVRAVTRADFDQWVQDEQAKANKTPAPAPSGAATLVLKAISATAGFDQKTLSAPADTPLAIDFTNSDTTVPHNFAIKGANPDGTDWFGTPFAPAGGHELPGAAAEGGHLPVLLPDPSQHEGHAHGGFIDMATTDAAPGPPVQPLVVGVALPVADHHRPQAHRRDVRHHGLRVLPDRRHLRAAHPHRAGRARPPVPGRRTSTTSSSACTPSR